MRRIAYFAFAGISYLIFLGTFLYLIAFVGDLPFLAHTVDRGPTTAVPTALLIDIGLILLFGLQHSVMARQSFKRSWTRTVPEPIERSVYVLAASLTLMLLMLLWRPIEGTIWRIDQPVLAGLIWALFAAGWLIVLVSTFLINHFDLFGLAQVFRHWRGRAAAPPHFVQPLFYRFVRHPLYSGFFLAFWATPVMSVGHLLLALGLSTYMLIAIQYEERDMVAAFGRDYESYRDRVGMLAPRLRRGRMSGAARHG